MEQEFARCFASKMTNEPPFFESTVIKSVTIDFDFRMRGRFCLKYIGKKHHRIHVYHATASQTNDLSILVGAQKAELDRLQRENTNLSAQVEQTRQQVRRMSRLVS
jgi:hypothetical protein